MLLLNCEQSVDQIIAKFSNLEVSCSGIEYSPSRVNLRHGVGAQILKDLGVRKMRLLANTGKMPSMVGYGLEIVGYQRKP